MLPLIAISTSEVRTAARSSPLLESDPQTRELALGVAYPAAVAAGGGLPVMVPPVAGVDINEILDRVGGLLLSGGPDLDPASYGETPHAALGPTEPELDAFELGLMRGADQRGMPVLALCRGAQVLNVARGGTLLQDLPDLIGDRVCHRQREAGTEVTHTVRIAAGSHLALVTGAPVAQVNSFHHQAAGILGRDLEAVAWAEDGVIEGIEATDRTFVVGVQWHAESLASRPEQAALFAGFVAAAAAFEMRRPSVAAA